MSQNDYPLPGFHFLVDFTISGQTYDQYFQSVGGLNVEMTTESFKEGGENRFEHQIPVRTKYGTLVLKRGVLKETELITWFKDALEHFYFSPATVNIKLLGEDHNPLITWSLTHVWPKKWDIAEMDASKNEVLVETLEMNYNFFKVTYNN